MLLVQGHWRHPLHLLHVVVVGPPPHRLITCIKLPALLLGRGKLLFFDTSIHVTEVHTCPRALEGQPARSGLHTEACVDHFAILIYHGHSRLPLCLRDTQSAHVISNRPVIGRV